MSKLAEMTLILVITITALFAGAYALEKQLREETRISRV